MTLAPRVVCAPPAVGTSLDSAPTVVDRRGRPIADLRVSVTDRCNLRCAYCMPEDDYEWLDRREFLSFEELTELIAAFGDLGVTKVRLTGGEPLLRQGLPILVSAIAELAAITDIALTTNGTLLAGQADALRSAGLRRVTVSLDTLQSERHRALTRRDNHGSVLDGIRAAHAAGFVELKINTVVMRGVNDDELVDLIRFADRHAAEIRFIEYMDVAGATGWQPDHVVPAGDILDRVAPALGPITPVPSRPSAPASRYRTAGGTIFGIVASTTTPFCSTCDRSRLTADGIWYRCLYAEVGTNLREVLRAGTDRDGLRDLIAAHWQRRQDQGAVERAALASARTAVSVQIVRSDPHREMHTRGG